MSQQSDTVAGQVIKQMGAHVSSIGEFRRVLASVPASLTERDRLALLDLLQAAEESRSRLRRDLRLGHSGAYAANVCRPKSSTTRIT